MNHFSNKNYFTMPNEIFSLGLDASEIAVYAYLRCLENRSTYQCWPSYTTIGNLRYTIRPIREAIEIFHARQLSAVERAAERQRVQRKMSAMDMLPGA